MELFSPIEFGPYQLPNRIVMAPMTRQRADESGAPNDLVATYYKQRASAGLIVSECTKVSETATGYVGGPGLVTDEDVAGWRKVTDAVHAVGGRIYIQVWHAGRVSHSSMRGGEPPVAPSPIRAEGQTRVAGGKKADLETPRELTIPEIHQIVEDFGKAARRAIDAGADGVEIHGAFGYLIDSFLQESSNQRTDEYGGSPLNRARFAIEVAEAVVHAVGADRVGMKIGPSTRVYGMHDAHPKALFRTVIEGLNSLGLSYLHVMEPSDADLTTGTVVMKEPSATLRPMFKGKLISNVGFTLERAIQALAAGTCDMVSFGKAFIANPDLPRRFVAGGDLAPVDFATLFTPGPRGYVDYPALAVQFG
jgi:N-ethylmaleimide reductase